MTVLRTVFFLIVLANLVLFTWVGGYLGNTSTGREPGRLTDQKAPERLRIIGRDPAPATPPVTKGCRLVSGLSIADAERLGTAVAEKTDGLAATVTPVTEPAQHWVHVPALPTKAAADKKAAEIRQLGVTDFHLLQEEGSDQFTISLGVFGSEQAATDFLRTLNKKGVKSARVDARPKAPEQARVEVRGPTELLTSRLPELVATPSATIADCPP